jgi:hypothetical protein
MRALDPIRKNPVAALCVVIAGVVGWVAATLAHSPDAPRGPVTPPELAATPAVAPSVPLPPPPPSLTPRAVPADLLPKIKPGMTRVEVEVVLGPPTSESLHPAFLADNGRLTYRMAYDIAEPDAPATVRPIGRPARVLPRPVEWKTQVALEFDASQPGHPLVNIFYLDPLF